MIEWLRMIPVLLVSLLTACASDSTASVKVQRNPVRWNKATRRGVQQVVIKNVSSKPLAGPLSLVLDEMSVSASLHNRAGVTECAQPQGPFINVGTVGKSLLPGASVTAMLEFEMPPSANVRYRARLLSGSGAR